MEFGVLADRVHHSEAIRGPERALEWVRGLPRKSWWNHAFITAPGDRLPIATMRCTACGFLELYAPVEPAATAAKQA